MGFSFVCFRYLSDTYSFEAVNTTGSQGSLRNWFFFFYKCVFGSFFFVNKDWTMEVKEKETLILLFFPNPLPFVSRPEKLDLEKVVSIDQLKKKISPLLFYKETYVGAKEGKLFCINLFKFRMFTEFEFYFILFSSSHFFLLSSHVSVEEWNV